LHANEFSSPGVDTQADRAIKGNRVGKELSGAMPSNHFGVAAVVPVRPHDFSVNAWYYLDSLAAPNTSSALALIKKPVEELARPKPVEAKRKPLVMPAADPAIKTIQFKLMEDDPLSQHAVHQLHGSMPLGNGTDLFWTYNQLFVMEEPGILRPIYGTSTSPDQFVSQAYDGRYVWLAIVEGGQNLQLAAIDLGAKKVMRFSNEDGIPGDPRAEGTSFRTLLQVAAVGPGHVCIAGHSGGKSWVGNVFLSPEGEKRVDIFHEASEVPDDKDPKQLSDPKVAFQLTFIYSLHGSGAKECRV
jgi:hypothetical protein